ncbi:SPOR domain-containing protein [Thermodesulfobacteriota bacterium]
MSNVKWIIFVLICSFLLFYVDNYSELKAETLSNNNQANITIQVSSVKNEKDAQREVGRLKSHDLNAFMRHEPVKNKGMWYRIYIGLFENKDVAMEYAEKLMKEKIISYSWVKEIKNPPEDIFPTEVTKPAPPIIEEKPDLKPTEPSPPPSKAEETMVVPPPVIKPTEKQVEPEKVSKEERIVEKLPEPQKPATSKKTGPGKFSMGLKAGAFSAGNAAGFEISSTNGNETEIWRFNDSHFQAGLILSYQLTRRFSIDGSYEKAFSTDLDLSQFTIGSSYDFNPIGRVTPYLKGSLVMGSLGWSDAPGDFDNGFGWQLGLGAYTLFSMFEVGLEASYQGIEYKYNAPSGVSATDSKIDFSGFAVMGTIAYWF